MSSHSIQSVLDESLNRSCIALEIELSVSLILVECLNLRQFSSSNSSEVLSAIFGNWVVPIDELGELDVVSLIDKVGKEVETGRGDNLFDDVWSLRLEGSSLEDVEKSLPLVSLWSLSKQSNSGLGTLKELVDSSSEILSVDGGGATSDGLESQTLLIEELRQESVDNE